MKRKIKLAILFALVAALLVGCSAQNGNENEQGYNTSVFGETVDPLTAPVFTDRDAVYEMYNAVNIGDTLDSIVEKYGEPSLVEEDDYGSTYTWVNEAGYGMVGLFYENGRLRSKSLYFEDMRQLKELSAATSIENFALLETSHDFSMVCLALGGKPCEIAAIAQDSSLEPEIYRVFAWLDEYGSNVQVMFNSKEKIIQVAYSLADRTK